MFDLIAELAERIEKLERRLGQNSRNSSLPPSSDRPSRDGQGEEKPRPRKRSGKKRGAQQGHKGSGRVRTEHRMLRVVCPDCGTHNRAELPTDVEQGAFGLKLRASVVTLAVMLMSRRTTVALLKDMFGARISVGSVDNILKQAGELLASPWQAIQRAAQAAEVLHADETSWRRAGQRIWLWAALSATSCCFRIDQTRARSAAKTLLGDFDGLLICPTATPSMTS